MGVELVIQPPPGWDVPNFYCEAQGWCSWRFEHVLSAVIHRDQKRPHTHVLILPISDGRLAGAAMTSGANRLSRIRTDFYGRVEATLGLRRFVRPSGNKFESIFTSAGKGPRNRCEAARRDAASLGADPAWHWKPWA